MRNKLISILIVSLFILFCDGNTLTFYDGHLTPRQIVPYSDNSVVIRLVERLNKTCFVPNLTYRILYTNGTESNLITVSDDAHQIPSYNFCIMDDASDQELQANYLFYFEETITNYVLVRYGKIIEENNTISIFVMMIDWSGNITSSIPVKKRINYLLTIQYCIMILNSNTLLGKIGYLTIYTDGDSQVNYLFAERIESSYDVILKKFKTSPDGELVKVQEDLIQMPKGYQSYATFNTVNYELLFVFIYKSKNNVLQSTLEPEWKVYGSILQKDSNQLSQFLIYQTSVPQLNLLEIFCAQSYDGSGFYCNIAFTNLSDTNYILTVRVIFLSSGKIVETEKDIDINLSIDLNHGFDFLPLKSGGFLITISENTNYGCRSSAYLYPNYNFSITVDTDFPCADAVYIILNNNTGLGVQEIKENYWTLLIVDFPRVMNEKGYGNPIVSWTAPAINETISVGTTQIQVAYNVPIECSTQNISIYQKVNDTKDILREMYSGVSNNCQVLSDNTTLSLTVLSSTFNQPNSIYYVNIDPNFVKHNATLEPLSGITKYKWIFFTDAHHYEIDDSINAFVRLTPDATLYFENLSDNDKSNFSQNLIHQLAEIIPIPYDRITTYSHYQIDSTASSQILIPMRIIKSNDDSAVINASATFESLNTLIKNKEITSISKNELTSKLDESYGLVVNKTLLDIITIPVIVMGVILSILIICCIWAHRRCKEGKNYIIIVVALMLYDFVMDILFIFDIKTKKIMPLFWMSLIFTISPILLNLSVAFYIMSKENSENPKFYGYFLENSTIVSICSTISGADIEILQVLSSNFAGFNIFTAPFSKQAEKYIFWCSLIGFCFEDIPQFSIQIAYKLSRVEYTIVPALTLISSSLMLVSNIIGRLYHIMIKCRKTIDYTKMQQNTSQGDNDANNSGMSVEEQKDIENNSYSRIRRITI